MLRIGKLQIGPIKYDEIEVMVFAKSFLLGLPTGFPLGVLLNYALGFPTIPSLEQAPTSFSGWTAMLFVTITSFESLWLLITLGLYILLSKRLRLKHSLNSIGKFLLATFIFFPVLTMYCSLVSSAIFVPIAYAFPGLGFRFFWITNLLILPFLALFGAIFLPDSPAGKFLRHPVQKLRGDKHRK